MKNQDRRPVAGFTLIELLIVVAVIGIIAAIAIPNLLNAINKGRQKRSMADLRTVGTALAMYQRDNAFFPKFDDTEVAALRSSLLVYVGNFADSDGWSTPIAYDSDGRRYTLVSYGKDKTANPPYTNTPTNDFDSDIVFSDGMFYQWPEGSQE